ncbi:MAG: serine/threonine protein kinase, partial [Archangium sp.]|nr:serine/threonine protein kinase [Archangium sp.]
MSSTSQDKLFGLLAVQLGFMTAEALKHHAHTFARSGEKGFGTFLVKEGVLTLADVALLEACADRGIKTHQTAARALNALTLGAQALTQSSIGFEDTHSSGERGSVSHESLEGLEFVVPEMPGRYGESENELGRGGLGRVLALKDHVLGRSVAWKELHRQRAGRDLDTLASMEQEARFLREARLCAQLEHPSIVPIYEVGRKIDGTLYYTMRRIEGRHLGAALDEAKTLEARLKLMPHLIAVTQALAYAHSRDVLHRDVKPQNVMLGKFGETYLLDWGLAKVKAQTTKAPGGDGVGERNSDAPLAPDISAGLNVGAVGTPSYMSPEQAAGRHDVIDHRTDVWGVGAILYQVLTGRPPYVGTSPMDCLARILRDDVLPVKELESGAPNDLVAVCHKALQRRPDDRYLSASQLAADLQAWLEGRTVSAREYSTLTRGVRFAKRHKFAVSMVAALFFALVVTGTAFTLRLNKQRREARALSGTILNAFIVQLAQQPGAERIIDEIATPALAYYRAQGNLSDEELVLFGRTLQAIGTTSAAIARLDTAKTHYTECVERFSVDDPRAEVDPEFRAIAVGCAIGRYDLSLITDQRDEGMANFEGAQRAVEKWGKRDLDSAAWLRALSLAYSRLTSFAQAQGEEEDALKWINLEYATDTDALLRNPTDSFFLANHAASSTRMALARFKPTAPAEGLEIARHGLQSIEAISRAHRTPRVLRVWLGLLEQTVMMEGWAGLTADADAHAKEAQDVFDQLMSLEPKEVQGRGIYGDLLLARGRPCEAQQLYTPLVESGVHGTFFTSWLLAAVACKGEGVEKLNLEQVKANDDPQAQWLYALWLLTQDRSAEASKVMDECAEKAANAAIQWPRGVLDTVPPQIPDPRRRAAVQTFIGEVESLLRTDTTGSYDAFPH